jgi:hypothetical protein
MRSRRMQTRGIRQKAASHDEYITLRLSSPSDRIRRRWPCLQASHGQNLEQVRVRWLASGRRHSAALWILRQAGRLRRRKWLLAGDRSCCCGLRWRAFLRVWISWSSLSLLPRIIGGELIGGAASAVPDSAGFGCFALGEFDVVVGVASGACEGEGSDFFGFHFGLFWPRARLSDRRRYRRSVFRRILNQSLNLNFPRPLRTGGFVFSGSLPPFGFRPASSGCSRCLAR